MNVSMHLRVLEYLNICLFSSAYFDLPGGVVDCQAAKGGTVQGRQPKRSTKQIFEVTRGLTCYLLVPN